MDATQETRADGPTPIFRRPTRQDALDLARAAFLSEARVEIGVLAAQLSISRVTLYRWFTREKLLEQVLVQLAGDFVAAGKAEAEGEGAERILDFTRRIMEATVKSDPLRSFIEREPQLALRLLIGQRGAVHARIVRALSEVIAETDSPARAEALAHNIDVVVRVGTALQWATLAIGEEPQTEDAVDILRVLLNADQ
ncbi:MAG TPA: QsdR family transcriptional regulator [Solirubrobacteraceae bacterium]|nr:QsdR family transcriptional regulator [Solirubrobacteraceae bacterium]